MGGSGVPDGGFACARQTRLTLDYRGEHTAAVTDRARHEPSARTFRRRQLPNSSETKR